MRKSPVRGGRRDGSVKRKVLAAVRSLPPQATIEDAIERLVLLAKIDRGLIEVSNGKAIDHDEAKRRLHR